MGHQIVETIDPKILEFLQVSHDGWVCPYVKVGAYISERDSHRSVNFSDLFTGETGAKTMMMGYRQSGTA